jgi:hypothetical protein
MNHMSAQVVTILPVRRSIVEPDALVAYVLDHYKFDRLVTCKLLSHGHDDLYRIEDARSKFVLRVYALGNCRTDLEAQADILETMTRAGLPVVQLLRGNCGSVVDIPTPEGLRYAMLYAHAAGIPAGRDITSQQASMYGQLVAKLHRIADAADIVAPLKIDPLICSTSQCTSFDQCLSIGQMMFDGLNRLLIGSNAQLPNCPQRDPLSACAMVTYTKRTSLLISMGR